MSDIAQDFIVGTGGALLFLAIVWIWGRVFVMRGRPLSSVQKKMLGYGFLFMLGLAYTMTFAVWFKWPHPLMWGIIAGWGVLVGFTAWWRHRREKPNPRTQ
ncbi:MAG TPA: hypothetical protein VGW33_09265 [Terriglobia bacterium]|nr:hypothetical protein [Terriglobia bacterium]